MTFLPIVERELRVASRRQFTYWSRLVAAAFLLIIFGVILAFSTAASGMPWSLGQAAFAVLKWVAFVIAAAAGVFLTSDCLSEEKREGTLGLLFLTDLRGHDVVAGKLMSQSLQAFYGLLAVFPILALPLLAGGVTGVEFGRILLVICNTLFFSLAIGLFVSAMSREVLKAINAAVVLSLVFLVGLPWLDLWMAHWDESKWECVASVASPGYLFYAAPNLWPNQYWSYLGLQHGLAWVFLIAACVVVPRAWKEKSTNQKSLLRRLFTAWRFGGRRGRLAFRKRLLDRDPILWLAMRDRWLPRFILLVTLYLTAWESWNLYIGWVTKQQYHNTFFTSGLLTIGLVLWMASQACRLNLDAVRNGAMELILVTPTSPSKVVHGQWKALWRTFLIPVVLILLLHSMNTIETIISMRQYTPPQGWGGYDPMMMQLVALFTSVCNLVFMLAAMAWFGMWMGLTNRKVSIAILTTILWVCVIPWIASTIIQIFTQIYLAAHFSPMRLPFWIGSLVSAAFELAKNIFFITWSRHMLMTKFRETVSEAGQARGRRWGIGPRRMAAAPAPQPLIT